jgi:hypothetical protein
MLDRIEKYLFITLLFSIPFQIRKIVFYEGWQFNEWLSFSIYFTDVVFFCLFAIWMYYLLKRKALINRDLYEVIIFIFFGVAGASLLFAKDMSIGLFGVLRMMEFFIFFIYAKEYAIKKFSFYDGLMAIILGGVFQSIVAIVQFIRQTDLGLRFLGEGMLGIYIKGVAVFVNENGERVMRAYGTTPHPNVLAGYLFVAIFALYFAWLYRKQLNASVNYLYCILYAILLLGLFLTFSRTIIFLWFVGLMTRGLIIGLWPKYRSKFWYSAQMRNKLISILIVTCIVVSLFTIFLWPDVISRIKMSSGDEAVQLRIYYAKESLSRGFNWFGAGAGNFIVWLKDKQPNLPEYLYQPVHNIYLLIYSELGIIGLICFLLLIFYSIYDFYVSNRFTDLYHYSFFLVFLSILAMGLFDHFLWTLQQGRFVLWLSIALIAAKDINFE